MLAVRENPNCFAEPLQGLPVTPPLGPHQCCDPDGVAQRGRVRIIRAQPSHCWDSRESECLWERAQWREKAERIGTNLKLEFPHAAFTVTSQIPTHYPGTRLQLLAPNPQKSGPLYIILLCFLYNPTCWGQFPQICLARWLSSPPYRLPLLLLSL